jgi:tetratricopeptide (TPR) repeat protein
VYSEAIKQYNLVLETLENPSDTLVVVVKNHLGEINLFLKNFPKAHQYLTQSKSLAKKTDYQRGLAVAMGITGSCYEKEGNYLEALREQENSLAIFSSLGDQNWEARVNENIGSIYEDLEQFDKAYYYFEKSFNYLKDSANTDKISILNNIGDVYRKTGKYEQAIVYSSKALELAEKLNEPDEMESAHKDLSEIYYETGEFQKAYDHLNRYDEIQNEIHSSESLMQLNTLQTTYDNREREAEIALLTKQNQINKANQKLLLGGTFTLVLISGIFYYNLQRKRRDRNRVQQYEQELLQVQLDKKAIEEKKLNDEIHLKTASLSKYSLNIAQKNKLIADVSATLKKVVSRPRMEVKEKLKTLIQDLETNLGQAEEWDEFMGYFKEIHPQFFKHLNSATNSKLTSTEYRLAMLLRLKMSSKEIASILRITPDSVRVARYRFRKKLPLDSNEKLTQFMQEL